MQGNAAFVLERIELDHQDLHRHLAELRAALQAGIRSGVTDTLRFVRLYVDAHFAREEREMVASRYPLLHVHRAAHGRMSREVRAFETEWAERGVSPELAARFLDALTDWFEVHVQELDAQLIGHLRGERRGRVLGWPTNLTPFPRSARH